MPIKIYNIEIISNYQPACNKISQLKYPQHVIRDNSQLAVVHIKTVTAYQIIMSGPNTLVTAYTGRQWREGCASIESLILYYSILDRFFQSRDRKLHIIYI